MSTPLEAHPYGDGKTRLLLFHEDLPIEDRDPLALYARIRECHPGPSYLLESADTHPGGKAKGAPWGRYSYLGFSPLAVFRSGAGWIEVVEEGLGKERRAAGNPLQELRALMERFGAAGSSGAFGPLAAGGMVGYCNYDLIRFWEHLPALGPFDPVMPEAFFMVAGGMVIFDHFEGFVRVAVFALEGAGAGLAASKGCARVLLKEVSRLVRSTRGGRLPADGRLKVGRLESNVTRKDFMERVQRARENILAGDAIQVVLSQRFSADFEGDALDVYRVLRRINPSPYMFYLDFHPVRLIGASPEMLTRLENGRIEVCPIAGTRPRGADAEQDAALERELLADPKERAEHVMLVDLGRNDVGRVASPGSVNVPLFMSVERYSHVMHLVSRVEGLMKPGKDGFDAFMSVFPAGTVSGAPKIRAMEIIQELEGSPRGPYAGAVGWFGFGGGADFCITIRTLVLAGGKISVQAGAGIVADSDPAAEYEETLGKAAALLRALQEAETDDCADR